VWIEAHKRVAEKWLGRMPPAGLPNWGAADYDWKGRALQAEAEAGAERLTRVSIQMKAEAQARRHKADMEEVVNSTSWRCTRPLRVLGQWVRRLRPARDGRNRTELDARGSVPANLHAPATASPPAAASPTSLRGSASTLVDASKE
jgi:hypothetical protein